MSLSNYIAHVIPALLLMLAATIPINLIKLAGPSSRNYPVKGTIWGWVIEMIAGIRKFDNATAGCTWNLTKSLPSFVNLYISKANALET